MKYLFFKNTSDDKEDSNEVHNLKIYKVTTKYIESFSEEMLENLNGLIGKSLNTLPFLGSFLGSYNTVLLNYTYSKGKVIYLLEYIIEKIEFNGTMPFKKVTHTKIECCHYLKHNVLLLTSKDSIEDKCTLCSAALIPYYLLVRTSCGSLPGYKPPKWKEFSLSLEDLNIICTILGEMLAKNIESPLSFSELYCKLISYTNTDNRSVDIKPYRKNSYIIKIKGSDVTQNIIMDVKGGIKFNYMLNEYVISEMVYSVLMLNFNKKAHELLIPIGTILHEYFDLAYTDMYEDARIKQERRILEDFINLISTDESNKKTEDISYLSLTAAFNMLINSGRNIEKLRDSSGDFLFDYETLLTFISKYLKLKHNISLTEHQLESLVQKFVDTITPYRNSLDKLFL